MWRWAAFAVPLVFLIGVMLLDIMSEPATQDSGVASSFELLGTDGEQISLGDALADGDALLYFSMGAGCDGCFFQIPEIEEAAATRGLTLVPIMVGPAPMVAAEAARFGIDRPIFIDGDRSVSQSYGMLGRFGHGDQPSHSFALVRQDRTIDWVRHYAEMFVPSDILFGELDQVVGS